MVPTLKLAVLPAILLLGVAAPDRAAVGRRALQGIDDETDEAVALIGGNGSDCADLVAPA